MPSIELSTLLTTAGLLFGAFVGVRTVAYAKNHRENETVADVLSVVGATYLGYQLGCVACHVLQYVQ